MLNSSFPIEASVPPNCAPSAPADEHAYRLAAFDHPLQPEPGRKRQASQRVGRRLADIERDEPEVAGLQHERERPDGLLDRALIQVAAQTRVRHDMAADPEQAIEIDAGRRGRADVEHVERIDERDEFAARRGGREQPQQQARPARRSRPDELGQLPARKPAPEPRVQRGNAGRRDGVFIMRIGGGSAVVSVRSSLAGAEQRFEIGTGERGHKGDDFALSSPSTELYQQTSVRSRGRVR